MLKVKLWCGYIEKLWCEYVWRSYDMIIYGVKVMGYVLLIRVENLWIGLVFMKEIVNNVFVMWC